MVFKVLNRQSAFFFHLNKFVSSFLLIVPILFLVSCASEDAPTAKGIMSDSYLSSEAELSAAKEVSKDIVNWKVAKAFAEKELKDNVDYEKWKTSTLSERPIIIYDNAGGPLYYEFRVRDSNRYDIGYITANAVRTRGYPIAFTSEFPQDYSKKEAVAERSVKSADTEVKIVSAGYPSVALAPITKGVRSVRGLSMTDNDSEVPLYDEDYDKLLADLKDNATYREENNITDEKWDEMHAEAMAEKAKTLEFWDAVDSAMEEAFSDPEAEVVNMVIDNNATDSPFDNSTDGGVSALKTEEINEYILDRWKPENLDVTPYTESVFYGSVAGIACGPGAMTFIVAGFNKSLLVNKNWYDLYKKVFAKTGYWQCVAKVTGGQPIGLEGLNRALSLVGITKKYRYGDFYYDIFSSSGGLQSYLRSTQAPMLTLTFGTGGPHWMVMYGASDYQEVISFHFLKVRWFLRFSWGLVRIEIPSPNKKRYFIDNGAEKGNTNYFTKNVNWINGFIYLHYPLR